MVVANRERIPANVTKDAWDEAQMEIASLAAEARVHARYNIPRAKRLCEATLREGLFTEYHDASSLLGSLERLRRRHA